MKPVSDQSTRFVTPWRWCVLRLILLSPFAFLLLCFALGIDGSGR